MNNLRQIKVILYRLKRNFGLPVRIMVDESLTHNLQTGVIERVETVVNIKRAIIVTPNMIRDFTYDLSFIAANKNFTTGGYFDTSTRIMILDGKDIPSTYTPSLNNRCICEDKRYEFEELNNVTGGMGYMIKLRHLAAADKEDIIETSTSTNLTLSEETTDDI